MIPGGGARRLPSLLSAGTAEMLGIHDRLVALVIALCLCIGVANQAKAATFEEAISGFAVDSYGDSEAAIAAVAASGDKMAAPVIGALQDGRLLFDAQSRKVYIKENSGLLNAATGAPAAASPAGLSPVRLNNRLRRAA